MNNIKTNNIPELAGLYDWPVSFVEQIATRITNPDDLWRACQMYQRGTLKADDVNNIDGERIDIPALRHTIATNIMAKRKLQSEQIREMMAKQQAIADYYATCERLNCSVVDVKTRKRGVQSVFINDGRLVAFGYWPADGNGGIYMADNIVMPAFHWDNLHNELGNIRKRNRAFYKRIKQAARREPLATWRFDENTIRKHENR